MASVATTKDVSAPVESTSRAGRLVASVLLYVAVTIGALVMIMPFAWMLLALGQGPRAALPGTAQLDPQPLRVPELRERVDLGALRHGLHEQRHSHRDGRLANLLTCSMAAYAFARIEFPFRHMLFILFLATLMVPEQVTIIPLYIIIENVGLIDTLLSLIIPYALFNAFGVFLLRQFIKSLPVDLEEAAIVDGANRWTIYWRIILPLIRPALAAFGIFTFLFQWNNFFRPLVFLNSIDNYTVPLAINFFRGQYATDFALLMAGSAISIVPVLIVYAIGQRQIIEGIATTGLKQ